jgi:hypothetical protein
MRKSIFEILSDNFDINYEIKTIWDMFKNIFITTNPGSIHGNKISLLKCVDSYSFKNWKSRGRCVSPTDMMNRLGINEIMNEPLSFSDDILQFLEYVENMIKRCDRVLQSYVHRNRFLVSDDYQILKENITAFIEHFGYESHYFEDTEQVLITEKNPAATSAAEISEPEIGKKIIQYNHYLLKGNIDTKKSIIIALSKNLEPQRKKLEQVNSSLASDLFLLFNRMNLRHNNIDPSDKKNYQQFIAEMSNNDLEFWYDEIYQLILLSILLLDNTNRQGDIKTLKEKLS